ncbi:MAG: ComEC/Rec2 family competence protein [Nocardioidaceae bacterium]
MASSRLLAGAAALFVAAAAIAVAGLRAAAVDVGPVPELARERAIVVVQGRISSDPVERQGQFGRFVVLRMVVEHVLGRGQQTEVRSPVLVIAEPSWRQAEYGAVVRGDGRLSAAAGQDLAAVLIARGPPAILQPPGGLDRAVADIRGGINEAAAPLPETERVLVPALVNGDDAGMPEEAVEDFRTTGLTHLLAVSGANVTLVLGFVLLVARWCGARGRWLTLIGIAAVVFFVLVARPQPSVLRAAAMGVVGIVGLASGGQRRGLRALCLAVLVLVLADPWLARSVGFLLSVLATGGILLLTPRWRDRLAVWLPRWLAEAIAVPLAAQVVCMPVVAAISGQVSLVAVIANVLVAPAVGPTTVLGFAGGLLAVVSAALGHLVGRGAGLFGWWIVSVARHGADLDGAAVSWPVGAGAIATLTVACGALLLALSWLLPRRWPCLGLALAVVAFVLHPPARPGWPPPDWRLVMCDVGQGDGIVLKAAPGAAVVVDAGPDPEAIDHCLDRLGVRTVPLLLLTHFHADHVDGLAGVLHDRQVAEIEVSPLDDPPDRAQRVRELAAEAGIPVSVGVVGAVRTIGAVTLLTVGPPSSASAASYGEEGSGPNNASLVVLARIGGLEVLLAGDSEAEEQQAILAGGADLEVDVLKVAHHGSANQNGDFVLSTDAAVALVSVGSDNDYGHPSGHLLGLLRDLGARVYRTDESGDVAVVESTGGLAVVPWR